MRRLRIGLIGAGTIAQSAHLPAFRRLAGELELVAIADVRAEVAARVEEVLTEAGVAEDLKAKVREVYGV